MLETHAYVFVKPLALGKSRLAGALSASRRELLAAAMLAQTLAAALEADSIRSTTVVGGDETVRQLSEASGARWRPEAGTDLNGSLRAVIASAAEGTRVLYLPADLPLLTPDDLEALLAAGDEVVLAPDRWMVGTNAMLVPAGVGFEPALGQGSLSLHVAEAQRLGLTPTTVETPGLAFDVDTPDDLDLLLERDPAWWQRAESALVELGTFFRPQTTGSR
jgi:2-phospho-L-lactate/phosphoenolpyruvate guanylyltransferase